MLTRRQVFAGAATASTAFMPAVAAEGAGRAPSFRLGVCSYSFHEFARKYTIKMIRQLGVSAVSVKDFHIPFTLTAEEMAKAREDFHKAGLTIVSVGNTDLKEENPAALRRYFDYAKNCGTNMIVAAPTHSTLPAVEKLAKEYDMRIAIHTHGPEDQHFPSPKVVMDAVRNMDARIGLCMDVGHSMRTGADVVQEILNAGPRLLDIHMKDLRDGKEKSSQCDVGEGVMPVTEIFQALNKVGYKGWVNLEYEINSDNPLPGMLHSMGYMKGVLAGLAA
jgi:sugar phosphate isomerase/epimerase